MNFWYHKMLPLAHTQAVTIEEGPRQANDLFSFYFKKSLEHEID